MFIVLLLGLRLTLDPSISVIMIAPPKRRNPSSTTLLHRKIRNPKGSPMLRMSRYGRLNWHGSCPATAHGSSPLGSPQAGRGTPADVARAARKAPIVENREGNRFHGGLSWPARDGSRAQRSSTRRIRLRTHQLPGPPLPRHYRYLLLQTPQELVFRHHVYIRFRRLVIAHQGRAVHAWQCRQRRRLRFIDLGIVQHRVY